MKDLQAFRCAIPILLGVTLFLAGSLTASAQFEDLIPPEQPVPAEPLVEEDAGDPQTPSHKDYSETGITENQIATGEALDNQPGADDVRDALDGLPEEGPALDDIAPLETDALTDVSLRNGHDNIENVRRHNNDSRDDGNPGEEAKPLGVWVGGAVVLGDSGEVTEYGDGYDRETVGSAVGVDYTFGDRFTLGLQGGASRTDLSWDRTGSEGGVDSAHGGAYAVFCWKRARWEVITDFSSNDLEQQRRIRIGTLDRLARANYGSQQLTSYTGGSYDFELGGWRVTPMVGVQSSRLDEDGFTEEGAGSLNMTVQDRDSETMQSIAALALSYRARILGGSVIPGLRFRWDHEFETDRRKLDASFAEPGGTPFSLTGPEPAADRMEAGGGVAASILGMKAFIGVDVAFEDGDITSTAFDAGFRTRF